jgi:hypothetical protein
VLTLDTATGWAYICHMIHINVQQGIDQFKRNIKGIVSPEMVAKSLTRALNDTIQQGRSEAKRVILERYNVFPGAVNNHAFEIRKAYANNLVSKLEVTLDALPLISFKGVKDNQSNIRTKAYTSTKGLKLRVNNRAKKGTGVTVSVLKGSSSTIPFAFIQMMKNGYVGVFMRGFGQGQYPKRNKRNNSEGNDLKINELTVMSMRTAVLNQQYRSVVDTKLTRVFNERIVANLARLTKDNTV